MPRTCRCPYWIWGDDKIHCQGGRLQLPGKAAMGDYLTEHCASIQGWEQCSIAKNLMKEWNEK